MRKLLILFFIMMIFPINVSADHIYSIDMDIYLNSDGSADITEIWNVKADSGSEWYKTMYDLGESVLSNYEVYMDGVKLKYDATWNTYGLRFEKAGYYGINYTDSGIELCFGKSDLQRHTFILKYTLSNYVFNTKDSQVLYWTLLPKVTVDYFSVDVTSYYKFPDRLDVWGYGYKGYAYVKDGKISMSDAKGLKDERVVLLAKFPLNTFNIDYNISEFKKFSDVLKTAKWGSIDREKIKENVLNLLMWFSFLSPIIFFLVGIFSSIGIKTSEKYGYVNNKKINKKKIPLCRDIPCDKDLFYANILIKLNKIGYNRFNILGAILLKWIKENKIKFINKKTGIFNRDTSIIDLSLDVSFDNWMEKDLFNMIRAASGDGLLEAREFEKWVKKNSSSFLEYFDKIEKAYINNLKGKEHICKRINRKDCKYKNVMDDKIYNDSVELYGLKKYLEEFSRVETKEVIEVKLWDEYLMFAYLFGIADKVSNQLEHMYPEALEQMQGMNINYEVIRLVDNISTRGINYANNANKRYEFRKNVRVKVSSSARNYSSGGGGSSRSGGGSGSRGGGSRGSAGGR